MLAAFTEGCELCNEGPVTSSIQLRSGLVRDQLDWTWQRPARRATERDEAAIEHWVTSPTPILLCRHPRHVRRTAERAHAVVYKYSWITGYTVAERLGVPCDAAVLFPITPMRAFPSFRNTAATHRCPMNWQATQPSRARRASARLPSQERLDSVPAAREVDGHF